VEAILGARPWTSRTEEIIEANEAMQAEEQAKKKRAPRKKKEAESQEHEIDSQDEKVLTDTEENKKESTL
jgi:hypothetical protein